MRIMAVNVNKLLNRVEEFVEMLVELGQARQLSEQIVAFAA